MLVCIRYARSRKRQISTINDVRTTRVYCNGGGKCHRRFERQCPMVGSPRHTLEPLSVTQEWRHQIHSMGVAVPVDQAFVLQH